MHSMTPMNRPSGRTFQRKHLRVGSRLWVVRVAELLHHRTETHVLAQRQVHTLVALAVGFFCFKLRSSLIGPSTPECLNCAFCWWLVSALHSACFAVFAAWAPWNRNPMPFPQFEAILSTASSSCSSSLDSPAASVSLVLCELLVASVCMRVFVSLRNSNSGSLTARPAGQLRNVGTCRFLLASSSKSGGKCSVSSINLTL